MKAFTAAVFRRILTRPALPVLVLFMTALAAGAAFAQANPPLAGTVSAMTAKGLTITTADGSSKDVTLSDAVLVLERTPATLGDIKEGDAMGVTAHRAEGGMLTATEINIFSPELWKVAPKGQWPMQQAGNIMTNALVTSYAARANGRTLKMKYNDLMATIDVPDQTLIHRIVTKTMSDVKQGMHVLVRGSANPDGSFKASSVSYEG